MADKLEERLEKSNLEQQNAVSWFDFLFDESGDKLKKHLEDGSAGKSQNNLFPSCLTKAISSVFLFLFVCFFLTLHENLEPSAIQLIIQFLERSRVATNNSVSVHPCFNVAMQQFC